MVEVIYSVTFTSDIPSTGLEVYLNQESIWQVANSLEIHSRNQFIQAKLETRSIYSVHTVQAKGIRIDNL